MTRLKVAAILPALALSSCAQTAFVRVNQIGYETGAAARAYLMTSGTASQAQFRVLDSSGSAAFSGAVGAKLGTWGSFAVYALDFTAGAPGTYTISVSDPIAAVSPVFPIAAPARLYSQALANSLYFYQNQRDGPDFVPTPLCSAPGHLNDASAAVYQIPAFDSKGGFSGDLTASGNTIDASGGWLDAGDYLKFVETASYTTALLLIGVRDFPNVMGGGASDFTAEARFGVDWLQKMWDGQSLTLYH